MAKPRIFVSSTYYDLKHIRSSLEDFISELGYESILSESGDISYDPNVSLDISCYREASNVDIFVLIIGGRYGSPTSTEDRTKEKKFHDEYESVTKEEYNTASKKNIPTYILIEKAVYAEYQTFKKNKLNESIKYAHVDSINIFKFIDEILSKSKNNATHQFEKYTEIKDWLKEQWAGLFRELLHQRTENEQFNSLNEKVEELSSISISMKKYLENIMKGNTENADLIIENEHRRQEEERKHRELNKVGLFNLFVEKVIISESAAIKIFSTIKSIDNLADEISKYPNASKTKEEYINDWKTNFPNIEVGVNEIRAILGEKDITYE